MTPKTIFTLQNVNKQFVFAAETLTILENINLQIGSGDTVAITGPSGSGKSTLLGVMAGLESPTSGKVIFAGKEIQNSSDDELCKWRRTNIGFIFQNFRLVKTLTAIENVAFPLEIQGENTKTAQQRAQTILEELQLGHRLSHFPHQLSGGERQRVAIARAYIHNPKIIFADEPTGNLDNLSAEKVLNCLLSINKQHGTTLIVVTHDLQVANKLSRNLKLTTGRIHES